MRILIDYIIPVLLPTLLWLGWLSVSRRRARVAGRPLPTWETVPLTWLVAAGLALAMLIAVGGSMIEGYHTGRYHPAQVDSQGRLVPGRFD